MFFKYYLFFLYLSKTLPPLNFLNPVESPFPKMLLLSSPDSEQGNASTAFTSSTKSLS